MRYSRLHASCAILSLAVQSATSFLATGQCGLITSSVRYNINERGANAAFSSRRHSSRDNVRMGAASKKRKKLEKEALKSASSVTKGVAREAQRGADVVAEGLLEKCAESKRDLTTIAADIADLRSRTAVLKPAQSLDLAKDWRLMFASDDDALCVVGTGLHKLPLTRMQDFFVTLSGGSSTTRMIQAIEVLRVIGPFPNLRNTLTGDCKSTGPESLSIRYTSMIDGTGKETGSAAGEQDRLVEVEVAFVGQGALVLETKTGKAMKVGHLVFAKEPDLGEELAKLRVAGDKKKES